MIQRGFLPNATSTDSSSRAEQPAMSTAGTVDAMIFFAMSRKTSAAGESPTSATGSP